MSPRWVQASISAGLLIMVPLLTVATTKTPSAFYPFPQKPVCSSKPKLWLSEYWEVDKEVSILTDNFRLDSTSSYVSNDLISRNGSDYVITNNVHGVVMACASKYPIQWTFPHPQQIEDVPALTIRINDYRKSSLESIADPFAQPENDCFFSFLSLSTDILKFFSVNVTCSQISRTSTRRSSSAHLFFKKECAIEKQGGTIDVFAMEGSLRQDIVLPCRPADPEARVSLYIRKKGKHDSTFWEEFHPPPKSYFSKARKEEPSMSFDPKVGFILHNVDLLHPSEDSVLFQCVLKDGEASEHVYVNVKAGHKSRSSRFWPHSRWEGNASVTVSRKNAFVKFMCCSGDPARPPPAIRGFHCEFPAHCDLLKGTKAWKLVDPKEEANSSTSHLEHFLEVRSDLEDCSVDFYYNAFVVACRGVNIDFAQQYVTLLNQTAVETERNKSVTLPPASKMLHRVKRFATSPLSAAVTNPDLRKAWIILGKPIPRALLKEKKTKAGYIRSASYLATGQDESSLQLVRTFGRPKLGATLLEWDNGKRLYDGETVHVICVGVKYFYTSGARIRFQRDNTTSSILETADFEEVVTYSQLNMDQMNDMDLSFVVSKAWNLTVGQGTVDCYLPLRNSVKWDKVSYQLDVHPSVPPKFAGPADVKVYLGLRETGHVLKCHLSEGVPVPEIIMTKDGQPLDRIHSFNSNGSIVSLNFSEEQLLLPPITQESQGVYRCTAKNVKGEIMKTFRVLVGKSHSHAALIALSIVVSLLGGILLTVCGVHWYKRRQTLSAAQTPQEPPPHNDSSGQQ